MILHEDIYFYILQTLESFHLLSMSTVCKMFHLICCQISTARAVAYTSIIFGTPTTFSIQSVDLYRFDIVCLQKYNCCHSCLRPIVGPMLGVFCVECVDDSRRFKATAVPSQRFRWSCGHNAPKQYCFLCDMAWCRDCIRCELCCRVCIAALSPTEQ